MFGTSGVGGLDSHILGVDLDRYMGEDF